MTEILSKEHILFAFSKFYILFNTLDILAILAHLNI